MIGTDIKISTEGATEPAEILEEPRMFSVVFVNDDKTPMDFVIAILMEIYGHAAKAAERIMLRIHNEGQGVAGIYPHEIAEAKAVETMAKSRLRGFPLNCRLERKSP